MPLAANREVESFALVSAYRSLAFAAAQLHTEAVVGREPVQTHYLLLSSQRVPDAQTSTYNPSAAVDIARSTCEGFLGVGSDQLNAVIEAVKQGIQETFESPSFFSSFAILRGSNPPEFARASSTSVKNNKLFDMVKGIGRYWGYSVQSKPEKAFRALCFAQQDFTRLYWRYAAWRGVNLGGWFLLEPGPASPFFDVCGEKVDALRDTRIAIDRSTGDMREAPEGFDDEHSVCEALDAAGGISLKKELFAEHRATHYSEATFDKLIEIGLNAIRLPFGYWVVQGPSEGDSFEGPCLDALDKAVSMAAHRGLQVLLDLHGNPGGENAERPCGRINHGWTWQHWRMGEAIQVLELIAQRYKSQECVTGVQVCNEPSPSVPAEDICSFFERCIQTIRDAGMSADRVAIVVAIHTHWRRPEIMDCWFKRGNLLKYDNIVFDLHYYHDFSPLWHLISHSRHLQIVREHACELKSLPGAVVGEWSLSRPGTFTEAEKTEFARTQVAAYNHASHGWFFWNWHDHIFYDNWDFERGVIGNGRIPSPMSADVVENVLEPQWESDSWRFVPEPKLTVRLGNLLKLFRVI